MKCFAMLLLGLSISSRNAQARLISVTSLRELEDRTFGRDIACVVFYALDKKTMPKEVYAQVKAYRALIKDLARFKRYRYAYVPFITVDMARTSSDCFIRRYHLNPCVPSMLIMKQGKPMAGARLDGYVSEENLKNFIECQVGSDIDQLVRARQEYERCAAWWYPAWIHDWYFYWPCHYYGYGHPYYWHDGFNLSCGC